MFSWIAALLIAAGLWMFYVALTGYAWWFTFLQKTSWNTLSAILTFFGIGVYIIMVLDRERKE